MVTHAASVRAGSGAPALPALVLDSAGRIIYINEAAQRMFGACMLEALDNSFEQLVAERSRAEYRSMLASLHDDAQLCAWLGTTSDLFCRRGSGGGEFQAEASITTMKIGHTRGYVVAIRDVTEARRTARDNQFLADLGSALGTSLDADDTVRAFARLCADHFARCCVVAIDETDTHPQILEVACRDSTSGEIVHLEPTPALPDGLWPVIEGLASHRRAGDVTAHEEVIGSSWNTPHPAAYSRLTVPIRVRGVPAGLMLLLARTGDDEHAEPALAGRAAERLASALDNARLYDAARHSLRAHDEMLSFVSHDLRNPLNVITMAADFLRERAAGDEFTVHWLDAILHGAERMNTLITDLLTDARAEAGGPALRRHPVGAGYLIREAFDAHDDAARRKGLHVTFSLADDTLRVKADPSAVVRALSNLIGNAVKYTPPDGTVTISASVGDDDTVEFCVEDTGPGIDPEHIPHVFDRFWQAPGTRSGGTGLGLAIVKSVIEAHEGQVWVESRVGAGSTFHFTLPVAQRAELATAVHP
jgi:PAS domain S-box-containing protein